ncbi:MAG TPA: ABC transporter substrate-binding protein [Actinophytocola sp.]|jgi:alpha-glucoside transport system substrate-binding protein|uniref:ABC transporter substrate-binding protein n=1 Tax=Actinophytocola sp. TaxID=1872138 RepID=UPI002F95CBE1
MNIVLRRYRVRLVTAAVATVLVASACGGDDGGSGDLAGELRVVTNWTGSEGDAFQKVIDGFEKKNPDIHVKVEQVPFDQTQALLTQQFAQGAPPDVSVALPGIIRTLSGQHLLLDLDDTWDGWIADGDYPESLRQVAEGAEDATEAVYFKGNVNGLIWYDPTKLANWGIQVPTTWDDFLAAAGKVKAAGVEPFAVGGKDGWPLTQWADPVLLRVAGPDAFHDLADGKIGWDDDRVVQAFTVLSDLMRDYFPKNALAAGFIDATCARAKGTYAFQNQGAFVNSIAPAECDKNIKPGKTLAFFPMPAYDEQVPAAQAVSGDLFIGAKATKHEAATRALLEYLGSAEAQTIWAKLGGYIAPNLKVPADVYPTSNDQAAAKLWPKGDVEAGYDLDDWIGGEIQVTYTQALGQLVRDHSVDKFVTTMNKVDTRAAK